MTGHFESIPNTNPRSNFSHFEIQTAVEFIDGQGVPYVEPVHFHDNDRYLKSGHYHGAPVVFGVYGRYEPGKKEGFSGAEHIADRVSLETALELVNDLNGAPTE